MKSLGYWFIPVCFLVFPACGGIVADDTASGIPLARIKESVICCPLDEVILDGWASLDIGGEVVRWHWDLDGTEGADTVTNVGEVAFTAPRDPCSRVVRLQVKDNDGNISDPVTAVLHVMKSPPVVHLGPDTTVKVGVRVIFSPRIETNCSPAVGYEWDFNNDGTAEYHSSDNGNTSRLFNRPGTYQARFRLWDSLGNEAGGIRTVTVTYGQP